MTTVGRFVWHDLMSIDAEASGEFYAALLKWTLGEPMPPMGYRVFERGETMFGGLMASPDPNADRSIWVDHIQVSDLRDAVERAPGLGGTLLVEPSAIPGIGEFAIVADPSGATLTLFQPGEQVEIPSLGPGGPGGVVQWNESITTDQRAVAAFFSGLFGWEFDQKALDTGGYLIARLDGKAVAGIFQPPVAPPESGWVTYFGVESVDGTIDQAQHLGAMLAHPAADIPGIGRTAWMIDPFGGLFGLMQPEPGWYERL
jgi:uncharacterized protein